MAKEIGSGVAGAPSYAMDAKPLAAQKPAASTSNVNRGSRGSSSSGGNRNSGSRSRSRGKMAVLQPAPEADTPARTKGARPSRFGMAGASASAGRAMQARSDAAVERAKGAKERLDGMVRARRASSERTGNRTPGLKPGLTEL